MHSLRLHSVFPALLVFSLVLTAATPLVRHACGMSEAEMATMPCCPPDAHEVPAHPTPDAPPCHDAPTSHDAPAEHDAPAKHDAPCPDASDWTAMRSACCASVEAPAAPAPERTHLVPADVPALVAAFVLPPEPPPSPPRWSGDLSPPAPVALHVLYERFLI